MKKLLFILFAFVSIRSFGQSSFVFCLSGSCKQTVNVGDSATLFVQMATADSTQGTFSWKQTGGPGITFSPKSGGLGGVSQSYAGVRPSSNGTYVFTITATSASGISKPVNDTLVVNAVARRIAYVVTVYTDSSRIKNQ